MLAWSLAGCAAPANFPVYWPERSINTAGISARQIQDDMQQLGSQPGPFQLTWSEGAVTAYLRTTLPPPDEIALWCEPNELYIQLRLSALRGAVLRVRLVPRLDNNALLLELRGVWIGERSVPPAVRRALQAMANDALADLTGSYALQQVHISQGQIAIRGTMR